MRGKYGFAVLFVLWCLSLFFAWWNGGFSGWFLFYSLSVLVVYSCGLHICTFRKVEVIRELSSRRLFAGDDLSVTLTLLQRSWIPLAWMAVQDSGNIAGRPPSFFHRKLFFPGFRSAFTYEYKIDGLQRGRYELNRIELITGDVFGFVVKKKAIPATSQLVVYPRPLTVREWQAISPSYSGDTVIRADLLENASQVSGVRDYTHGDPMNRIHWRTTSRLNVLKTKEMETAASKRMIVFLDAVKGTFPAHRSTPVFETCLQAAAGLLKYGSEHSYELGFISSGSDYCTMPLTRRFDLQRAYERLADTVQDGSITLPDTLLMEAPSLPAETIAVCVTPVMSDSLVLTVQRLRLYRIKVKLLFVRSSASLSWHDRQIKQELEGLGCAIQELPVCLPNLQEKGQGEGGLQYEGA